MDKNNETPARCMCGHAAALHVDDRGCQHLWQSTPCECVGFRPCVLPGALQLASLRLCVSLAAVLPDMHAIPATIGNPAVTVCARSRHGGDCSFQLKPQTVIGTIEQIVNDFREKLTAAAVIMWGSPCVDQEAIAAQSDLPKELSWFTNTEGVPADVPHIVTGAVVAQTPAPTELLQHAEAAIGHSCSIEDGCVVFNAQFEWDPNIETAHDVAMAIKRAFDRQLAACGLRIIDACSDWHSFWGKIVPAE